MNYVSKNNQQQIIVPMDEFRVVTDAENKEHFLVVLKASEASD